MSAKAVSCLDRFRRRLDEWQAVPGVLGAVKRAVDDETGAGRFLLTGSVRADLNTQTWPGTGRIVRLRMDGLTVREMAGRSAREPFLERLARADLDALPPAPSPPDLLIKSGKRYLVDPSLIAAALRLDQAAVLREGDLLGRVLETFVVAQIRPEAELGPSRPRLHHLRARDGGREVDLIVELSADSVVAIEIKATAAPGASDARHLVWLRDRLGERFLAGAVLHTGPQPFRLSERIFALPICALWG